MDSAYYYPFQGITIMSSIKNCILLVMLLAIPQRSYAFDPDQITPVAQYDNLNCDDSDYDSDYSDDYGDDNVESGSLPEAGPNACPAGSNPPIILVLEDGTRFMDSLEGGQSSNLGMGLLDKTGRFHNTGDCYNFVSVEDNLRVENLTNAINTPIRNNQIGKILLIVEEDQLETLSKSSSLRNQMSIIKFLMGENTFDNVLLIVGHTFDQKDFNIIERDARAAFQELFQGPPLSVSLYIKNNAVHFYNNTLSDPTIRTALQNAPIKIENITRLPLLLSDEGSKFDQTTFSVVSYYSTPEVANWKLEWRIGENLLWRVDGHSDNIISSFQGNVSGVIETRQEVNHIIQNLYTATVWIKPQGQQTATITMDIEGELGNITVSVTAWSEWGNWSDCDINLKKTRKRITENRREEETEEKECSITGLTNPNFCQQFTYPSPRILLLGETGVGKSTLGNLLLGVNRGICRKKGKCIECKRGMCKKDHCEETDSKYVCIKCRIGQCKSKRKEHCAERECLEKDNYKLGEAMLQTEKLPFRPGSGIDSKTQDTETFKGQFLGNGPCVTFIDTPGAADSKGRDYEHAIKMANFLKEEMGSFDTILLLFKGTDRRFSAHTIALLRLYQEIFGKEMWNNVIVEMSFWKHREIDACERKSAFEGLDEKQQAMEIKFKLNEEFGVGHNVPIVFIDPIFKGFHPTNHKLYSKIEKREHDIFKNQTTKLWNIIKTMPKYKCSENCQAPNEFFLGIPWLKISEDQIVEDNQLNFVIPCKIWDGIPIGGVKNSDDFEWYFNDEELFRKQVGMDDIYNRKLLDELGFKITPPTKSAGSFFAISYLRIERVDGKKHQGNFRCDNQKGSDKWKLNIPFWNEWGAWSQCSKTCRTYEPFEEPGIQKRIRECIGHIDELNTCSSRMGGKEETRACTGDRGRTDVFCPIPPNVTNWSAFGPCTPACGNGTKERSRTCKEGMFNENPIFNKCPTKNNVLYEKEIIVCTNGPCPKDCELGSWENWGRCTPSCSKKNNARGLKTRSRTILSQAVGNGTCGATEDSNQCEVPICPVDGHWSNWQNSGGCFSNKGCGVGRQNKERTCLGRKGSGKMCRDSRGYLSEYESKTDTCHAGNCPVDCVVGNWHIPSCSAGCDSSKTVTMTRSVITRNAHGGKPCPSTTKSFTCYGAKCPRRRRKGCYSGESNVTLASGLNVKMASLKIGDMVEVTNEYGIQGVSEFVGWLEKEGVQEGTFYKLTTESGNEVIMTGSHGLFIKKEGSVTATFAQSLVVGDNLIVSKRSNITQTERLVLISMVMETGWLDPLTRSGTIIVNNISTSCYASYPHWLANLALFPARHWPHIFLDDKETERKQGTRKYVNLVKQIGRFFSKSGFRMDDKYDKISKKVRLNITSFSIIAGLFGIFVLKTFM